MKQGFFSFVTGQVSDNLVVRTVFYRKWFWLFRTISGFFWIIVALNTSFFAALAQAQPNSSSHNSKLVRQLADLERKPVDRESAEPVDFSHEGRSGQQVAGESRGKCPPSAAYLAAIVPKSNLSKTRTSHPRWWFYFPAELRSQIKRIEFSLQDRDYRDLVRKEVPIPNNSYFSVTIPPDNSGIKPNQDYQWHLKVYCEPDEITVPAFVSGWVQKVDVDTEPNSLIFKEPEEGYSALALKYSQQGLWLDAVNILFQSRYSDRRSSSWLRIWEQIIYSPEISLEIPLEREINHGYRY